MRLRRVLLCALFEGALYRVHAVKSMRSLLGTLLVWWWKSIIEAVTYHIYMCIYIYVPENVWKFRTTSAVVLKCGLYLECFMPCANSAAGLPRTVFLRNSRGRKVRQCSLNPKPCSIPYPNTCGFHRIADSEPPLLTQGLGIRV